MPQATFHFPRGFLWGTATSSHQVEGYNTLNNWWAWEQQESRILNGHKSGAACDWWSGRWRDDFDRAAETGQNAHRLSIEWSRIRPVPDKWDESALERYREMVRGLQARNLTPLITLHHFTDPLWLSEKGGWESESAVENFVPYVRKVVEALRDYVNYWVTFNEPNVLAVLSSVFGVFPPGKKDLGAAKRVAINLARAHVAAYHAIHEIQPTSRVGIANHIRDWLPAKPWSPLDKWVSGEYSRVFNELFPRAFTDGKLRFPLSSQPIAQAQGTQDFIGINYYTQEAVSFNLLKQKELFGQRFLPPGAELSESGALANTPAGMFHALKWAKSFNLPIIITENGVEDSRDQVRPRYLIQHLHQVWRAVNHNFPIKGYFHWTLVDNFEWEHGWTQRFGLWELDVESQARSKRPSAELYEAICRENGISSEMVSRYAPEIFDTIFPK